MGYIISVLIIILVANLLSTRSYCEFLKFKIESLEDTIDLYNKHVTITNENREKLKKEVCDNMDKKCDELQERLKLSHLLFKFKREY